MNEKYKNWLKKFGIAGFLFFLIKGILWLIFGTAIYKWIKDMLFISAASLIPCIVLGQNLNNTDPVDYLSKFNQCISIQSTPILLPEDIYTKAFFCRLEDKWNQNKTTSIKFRLGSLEYSNALEYSKMFFVNEKKSLYRR